ALDRDEEYDRRDGAGVRFEAALEEIGYKGQEPAAPQEAYEAFLELHIEQGPRLDENDLDVGVVSGLVGISWGEIRLEGESNHSGPTPMHRRADTLAAAANIITSVRSIANGAGEHTVGTVGDIAVEPGSINVIPGHTRLTWDIRDPADEVVDSCIDDILQEVTTVADREAIEAETERLSRTESVDFPARIVETVESAAADLDLDSTRLVSGAVHDAGNVSRVCDAGMVFAVSEDGISHAEAEYTSWADCYAAANTLGNAVLDLAR
ncbi:MAG: hydantoinase/carbamoylase family amidase, partial [Salinirussus sp.]